MFVKKEVLWSEKETRRVKTRLKEKPHRLPLPSRLLANACSLEPEMDC